MEENWEQRGRDAGLRGDPHSLLPAEAEEDEWYTGWSLGDCARLRQRVIDLYYARKPGQPKSDEERLALAHYLGTREEVLDTLYRELLIREGRAQFGGNLIDIDGRDYSGEPDEVLIQAILYSERSELE